MAPPCRSFLASELPAKVQEDVHGRRRKLESGAKRVDLSACELFEMLQYKCEVERPLTKESRVQCFSSDRLFRRCKDRKGTFTVETTAWEGRDHTTENPPSSKPSGHDASDPRPFQWSSSIHHADSPK